MKKLFFIAIILSLFSSVVFAQRNYTAGEIQSTREVTYGRFEIMMYSSDVSGTTSTFFLWKNGGETSTISWNELDIETFGKSADTWQSNPIWEYNDTDTDIKRWEETHTGIPIAKTWVKFTLEWTPNYIAWYNNDVEVRRIVKGENVPASHFRYGDDPVGYIADPMRMAFNHWATFPGDWLGPWDDANLPSYQFVDWVTYQAWNGTGFDAVSIRQDFNDITDITDNYSISTHTFDDNQCQFSTNSVGVTNGYMWLGIFNSTQERPPVGAEIPASNNPISYVHELPGLVEAEEYNDQFGLEKEVIDITEGVGENLGYSDVGDYAEYTINVLQTGDYDVNFRVASLNGNAGLSLSVDGTVVIADLAIDATGGWQVWNTINDKISLTAGEHTLRFDVIRAGFNLNWISFGLQEINPIIYVLEIPGTVKAEQYSLLSGLQAEPVDLTEGTGNALAYTTAGDYAEYTINVSETCDYNIDFRVASLNGGASFSISIDGVVVIPSIAVGTTGGWQSWTTLTETITLTKGEHTLRFDVIDEGFNIYKITFSNIPADPVVSFTLPLLTTLDGNVQFQATAYDASIGTNNSDGIDSVVFVLKNNLSVKVAEKIERGVTYDYFLNTLDFANGNYEMSATVYSTENGIVQTNVDSYSFSIYNSAVEQQIVLTKGWNLISLYLDPNVADVAFVFPNATVVKTADAFYHNTLPLELNSLENIEGGKAYLVYNNINENITIAGTIVSRGTTNLEIGWNMIGVPTQVNYVLSNLPVETIVVKDFNGFYEPLGGLNAYEEMEPGKGYYIKVTGNCNIVW